MFRSRSAAVGVFFALVFLSFPTISVGADSTKFKIQDYIPERVTDFQWKLDGDLGLARSVDETVHSRTGDWMPGPFSQSDGSASAYDLGIVNHISFRRQTKQTFLICDVESSLRLNRKSSSSSSGNSYEPWKVDTWSSSNTEEDIYFNSGLVAELWKYILSDFHLALRGDFRHRYEYAGLDRNFTHDSTGITEASVTKVLSGTSSNQKDREIKRRIDFSGEALIGWGREYEGQYAATAAFLIEQLNGAHLLARRPSPRDIIDLTALVHQLRVGHSSDYREYRETTLQTLVDHLFHRGLLLSDNAVSVMQIAEVWDYFPNEGRRFGWSVQFGFGGVDTYYHDQADREEVSLSYIKWDHPDSSSLQDSLSESLTHTVQSMSDRYWHAADYLVLRISHFYPLSHHWYLASELDMRYHFYRYWKPDPANSWESEVEYSHSYPDRRTAVFLFALYYDHDSRTHFKSELELGYERMANRNHWFRRVPLWSQNVVETRTESQRRNLDMRLSVEVSYRIATPTTLSTRWTHSRERAAGWGQDTEFERDRSGFDLTVGVTHWLF